MIVSVDEALNNGSAGEPEHDHINLLLQQSSQRLYAPILKKITGNKNAALLLRQALYWWDRMGRRAFYKFMASCNASRYQDGQSWQEEMEFTRGELETAFRHCAMKITRGISKTRAMQVTEPVFNRQGRLLNSRFLIIYWTDSSRLTWFWLNEELLGNAINAHYLYAAHTKKWIQQIEPSILPPIPELR